MMKRSLPLLHLISLLGITASFSQSVPSLKLTGSVISVEKKPIPMATIKLYGERDSTKALITQSGVDGTFSIGVPDTSGMSLMLVVSSAAFEEHRQKIRPDTLHPLYITLLNRTLQEVHVKAKRETFQVEADRILINVDGSSLLTGGTLLDILDKTPRLQVDPQTKAITIDGKNGIQVYLNNRQVQLTADQVAKYLQSVPAGTIEHIEVLTNPPARYDANGGGVLLIFTKKSVGQGTTLDVTLSPGVGRFGKLNTSFNLSIRQKNWSAFAIYTPQLRTTYYSYQVNQLLNQEPFAGTTSGDQFRKVITHQHGLRVGGELNLGRGLLVGANAYGFQSNEQTLTQSSTQYIFSLNPTGSVQATSEFDNKLTNGLANAFASKTLPGLQGKLTADLDIASYQDNATTKATYNDRSESVTNHLSSYFPVSILLKSAKVDLETKPVKGLSVDAGVKVSHTTIGATPQLLDYTASFQSIISKLIQPFHYDEQIQAAYVNAGGSLNNVSWQLGVRYEHTRIGIELNSGPTRRIYANLFPTVSLQKLLASKATLKLSFNQRIVRPNFTTLNPAYIFLDPFTIRVGNPLLVPQIGTNLQLSYQSPAKHNLSVLLSQTKNRITEVVYRQDTLSPVLYSTQLNFNLERRLSVSYSFPLQLTKAWQMQTTLTGQMLHYSTLSNGLPFEVNASTLILNNMHTISLGHSWKGDLQIVARSATALGYMYYKPLFVLNMGVGRPLWNNRGSIKVAASDVFHTVTLINYGDYGYTNVQFRHRYETQTVFLTLSYRLGNEKVKRVDNRQTASEAEQERLQKQ